MTTPPSGGGNFLRAADLKPGDTAIIKTEADYIDSKFTNDDGTKQQQYVCTVDYNGEERRLKLTVASCDELAVFGKDSSAWVGKKIALESVNVMVGGSIKKSIYATPFGSGKDQPGAESREQATDETQKIWDGS